MRAQEFITESRQAPLYHFTSVKGLARILGSDKLLGRNNRIYFTRDYSRNFVPNNIHIGSFGLRLDQELLRRDYGKKLRPMGQTSMSNRQRLAWLSDPENQAQIARYKADPESLRVSYGVDVGAAVRGDMGQRARWESEEVIDAKEIPNISRYLTGIVFAGGGASGGLVRGGDQYGKRSTRRGWDKQEKQNED